MSHGNSHTRRGGDFERRVKKLLTDAGWWTTRSAASKGAADIVAIRASKAVLKDGGFLPRVAFVQAKLGGVTAIGIAEWDELYTIATSLGAEPVLVVPGSTVSPARASTQWFLLTGTRVRHARRGVWPLELWSPKI